MRDLRTGGLGVDGHHRLWQLQKEAGLPQMAIEVMDRVMLDLLTSTALKKDGFIQGAWEVSVGA